MSVSVSFAKMEAAGRTSPVQRGTTAAVMFVVVSCLGCGESDAGRVPVHPVRGTISFRGQAMPGALVSLHPKSPEGNTAPTPRGSVDATGAFTLTTYTGGDGAPEGTYVVTVQWYKPVEQQGEWVSGPNVLPPKYATPENSDVEVRVAAGENQLTPIELR